MRIRLEGGNHEAMHVHEGYAGGDRGSEEEDEVALDDGVDWPDERKDEAGAHESGERRQKEREGAGVATEGVGTL